MLALHTNESVSLERLVDGLWGEDPPATAAKMVQLYVSQLRRLLAGDDAQIVTHGRGYELRMPDDAVDAARFGRLVEEADRVDPAPNGAAREALALWHGAALADVADEPFAPPEIRRLDELWLRAAELAVGADLAAGHHERVLAELERVIDEHPLREHLHCLRMLALYRSGRQAEALEAYVRARRALVDGAGIEPGAELRELHERILRQDPSLQLPATEPTENGRAPALQSDSPAGDARGPPRLLRSRSLLVAAAVLAIAAIAVVAVTRLTGAEPQPGIDENAVGLIDPDAAVVTAQYPVGRDPTAVAGGGGSVWVANARDGTVSRIDRERDQVATIAVGEDPTGLAFAAGSMWVTDRQDRTVSQINPGTNRVVQTIETGNGPRGIASGFDSLWVSSEVDRNVTRIDLTRGRVTGTIDLGANPTALAAGAGAIWVTSEEGGTVFRIEPRTGAVAKTITVGNGPVAIAVDDESVWVANRQDGTVSRIDPATHVVTATVPVGRSPGAIAVDEDAVWVANGGDGTVSRIDPATRRVAETIDVANSPSALAIVDGGVWTAALASPASHRGGTLRVAMVKKYFGCCFGPSIPYDSSVLPLLYDGLVAYRRTGGSTYGRLVGNLAVDVPEASPDGRSYVFRLRPDIRFSNGALVRPEDFRASLEDLLGRTGELAQPYYGRIVGAPKCAAGPERCDLSAGIETDARAGTITIHLSEPDSELLHKLAIPYAWVTPADRPFGPKVPPPGTGPYAIASYGQDTGARLIRNRHFRVWSADARPDGFADEIVFGLGSTEAQVAAVQRGEADVMEVAAMFGGPLEPAAVQALAARYAPRMYTDPAPDLAYMFLNTRTPPFDDVRVRRALNYAVDRREIGRLAGGPDVAQSTCQLVPPGFPGYTPSCRYTTSPSPGGGWSGPDLARARRLIAQSGTKGMGVTVWVYQGKRPFARYFVSLLRRLGYRSALRVHAEWETYRPAVADSRTRAQIGIDGWAADYGAASNFTPLFVCSAFVPRSPASGNVAEFCDPRIEARIDEAQAARGTAADAIWQDVYRQLADAAPAVPLVNNRNVTLVSKRAGNHQHHPMWRTLFDQMWVR